MSSQGEIISSRSNGVVRAEGKIVTKTHARLSRAAIMEIPIMLQLSHPNLMYAYDLAVDERGYVLSMPRAECTLLDCIQSDCRFPVERIENLLSQIASGLAYLHQRNILHLDLKSDNIVCHLSEQTIRCKIIDFGTAEYLSERPSIITSMLKCTCTHRPLEGYFCTTSETHSELPTVELTKAFDVWSFGMIAFELYARRPIHKHQAFPIYTGKNDEEYEAEMQAFITSARFQEVIKANLPERYWSCLDPNPTLRPPITRYINEVPEAIDLDIDPLDEIQLPRELYLFLDDVFEFLVRVHPDYPLAYRGSVERLFHGLLQEDSLTKIEIEETLVLAHYFLDERYAILLRLQFKKTNPVPRLLRKEAMRKMIQLSEGRYALFDD